MVAWNFLHMHNWRETKTHGATDMKREEWNERTGAQKWVVWFIMTVMMGRDAHTEWKQTQKKSEQKQELTTGLFKEVQYVLSGQLCWLKSHTHTYSWYIWLHWTSQSISLFKDRQMNCMFVLAKKRGNKSNSSKHYTKNIHAQKERMNTYMTLCGRHWASTGRCLSSAILESSCRVKHHILASALPTALMFLQ